MNKLQKINGGGYFEYSAPWVTSVDVAVEKGFAASATIESEWGEDIE